MLDDLEHIAEVAENDARWVQYFPDISSELNEALLAEQRLVGLTSQLQTALSAVVEAAKSQKNPAAIKRKVRVAKALYGNPGDLLGSDLLSLIEVSPGTPIKKEAILFRLSTIASHVEYRGLADESASSVNLATVSLPPREVAKQLVWPLHASKREFQCAIAVDGPSTVVQSITLKTTFANALRDRTLPSLPLVTEWLDENKNCYVASVKVNARSSRTAAESQLQALSEILNLHNLYTNGAAYRVRPRVLVIEGAEASIVQVKPSSHFGLRPRRNAKSLTRDKLRKVDGRLRGRLANALESHALALAAGDPRTAIINLWTALEAISGVSDNQAIGRHVASKIAPLVAWRRTDKIVTYLALGFRSVLFRSKTPVLTTVMPHSKVYEISQDDVLTAITGPNKNGAIMYMLAQCDMCPLLKQRLFLEWKNFSEPNMVLKNFLASKRRVEWQIQRLYRARNLLVHKGEQSHLIWRLLQDAQYYVSISIGRVLHDLSETPDWDIDSSLDYQSMRFGHVCSILRDRSGVGLTHADLLGNRSKHPELELWL